MIIAALVIKAKKQSKCALMKEWINKICYIPSMEYYSEKKEKKFCNYYNVNES